MLQEHPGVILRTICSRFGPIFIFVLLGSACGDDDAPDRDAAVDTSSTDTNIADTTSIDTSSADAFSDSGPIALPECGAAAEAGWMVCSEEGDRCSVAFDDSEGCMAVCAVLGRACVDTLDTIGSGCEDDAASIGCAPTGHMSDQCICDRASMSDDGGVPDAGPMSDAGPGGSIELTTKKAFPSAQGLGVDDIEGGRGGTLFFVDDLSNESTGTYHEETDTHTGTLRYALQHPDPGTIIFRTAGVARSDASSAYRMTRDDARKTILGATAPAPGVILYGSSFTLNGSGHWIIRGLTFLGGDSLEAGAHDTFSARGPTHLALADNTFGWGADEAYSARQFDRLVAQRNLAFEGHPSHNVGSIFAIDTLGGGSGRLLSAHDNAYVHISHRFPNVLGLENDFVEVINQFAFNWGRRTESHKFQSRHNDINNYYRSGPRTSSEPRKLWNADAENGSPFWNPPAAFYTAGNIMTGFFDDASADNRVLWFHHITRAGYVAGDPLPPSFFVDTPHPLGLDVAPRSAEDAYLYNVVGRNVGARFVVDAEGRRQLYMLPLSSAYLDDAINGTDNAYLRDQRDFVLPSLPPAGAPYQDTDRDGMADEWERGHGLTVGVRDHMEVEETWNLDGATFLNVAGYTNLEIFGEWAHGGFAVLRDDEDR